MVASWPESDFTYFACFQLFPDSLFHLINSGFVLGFSLIDWVYNTICSWFVLYGCLLLTSGPTLLLEFRIQTLLWVCSGFFLGSLWVCSGIYLSLVWPTAHLIWICCALLLTLGLLVWIPDLLVQAFLQVFPWFTPGSLRVCSRSILHMELLTSIF